MFEQTPKRAWHDMARCDEGYPCEVCGRQVESLTESDLYLRYVLGEVPVYALQSARERHIRCVPALAQYIDDPAFEPVACDGPFGRSGLDPDFVAAEVARVTRGWRRLQALPSLRLSLEQYPLESA
jgi:hypothetical protein